MSRLRTAGLGGFLAILLATSISPAMQSANPTGGDKGKQPDYYPLALGNKWHYQMEVDGQSLAMTASVAKIEKIDERALARIEATIGGKPAGITEHLASNDMGVFRYRLNGQELDPPLCLLKYPIKEGESWKSKNKVGNQELVVTCKVEKWEQVEVPAGKFKTVRVQLTTEAGGIAIVTDYWFAADIGFVMQTMDIAGKKMTAKLEKFEAAKPTPP